MLQSVASDTHRLIVSSHQGDNLYQNVFMTVYDLQHVVFLKQLQSGFLLVTGMKLYLLLIFQCDSVCYGQHN